MLSTVSNNKYDYTLVNDINVSYKVNTISVSSVSQRTLYTNTTSNKCYCFCNIAVTYDITKCVQQSAFVVNDRFVTLNLLDNTVTFTGIITLQPSEQLKWYMQLYKCTVDNINDRDDNPLAIKGTVSIMTLN